MIVAPVTTKTLPTILGPTWAHATAALKSATLWIVVGYSLPEYDELVRRLFESSVANNTVVHVFDPDERVVERFRLLLPRQRVIAHPGIPEGLSKLDAIVRDWCDARFEALTG